MAKYTVEERDILEEKAGYDHEAGFSEIDDVLEKSWDKVFTTDCEFFDEDYRKPLCKKILKHFYMREIGAETAGLWQFWMNTELEEIMPYYNQLYKSTLLKYPIFTNSDIASRHTRENSGETSSNQTGTEAGTNGNVLNSNRDTVNNGTQDNHGYGDKDGTSDTQTTENKSSTQEEYGTNFNEKNSESYGENNETTGATESKTGSVIGTDSKSAQNSQIVNTEYAKETDNTHWDLYSDTPQGGLQNIVNNDGKDADIQYLTNFRKTTDDTTESGTQIQDTEGTSGETGNNTQTTSDITTSTGNKNGNTSNEGYETAEGEDSKTTEYDERGNGTSDTQTHDDYEDTAHQESFNEETSGYLETQDGLYDKGSVYEALGTSHDLEDFAEHTFGKTGSDTYAEMLMKFRETFLNIDMEVISKFEENFIKLW